MAENSNVKTFNVLDGIRTACAHVFIARYTIRLSPEHWTQNVFFLRILLISLHYFNHFEHNIEGYISARNNLYRKHGLV